MAIKKKTGKEAEFRTWLMQFKTDYKRERNFIKYVEIAAWGK